MHTVQIHDTYDMMANNRHDPMDLNCDLKLLLNRSCNADIIVLVTVTGLVVSDIIDVIHCHIISIRKAFRLHF